MMELARMLWDARRFGRTIDPAACPLPTSNEEAYAVQDAIAALSGFARRGFKVGSTSKEAQRVLGTDEPGAGVLLAPYVFASPARLTLVPAQHPAVEGEFAFRMATGLPPRPTPYTMAEVTAAIGAVAGAIEIVGTRFAGGLAHKGRLLTTADGGVNIALVTGPWFPFTGQDLRAHAVTMVINDAQRGTGTGSRALDDPLNVMLWLVNHLRLRGQGLAQDDIISTGTCTGLDPVYPGDTARADFGTLGTVEVLFD